MGTVDEIVFANEDNPNDNDLPLYVAVTFENYTGPIWDKNQPKTVPIPIITQHCTKACRCCEIMFCPLMPAYATTVHKFQGQGAGPSKKGQRQNEVQVIVCCPGSKGFEALNPGLMYTILSRATTLGDKNNKGSALYFIGEHISRDRFVDIHKKRDGKVYEKVKRRDKWINYLESRINETHLTPEETATIMRWSNCKRYSINDIDRTIDRRACTFKK